MVVDEGAQDAGSEQRRVAGELGLCEGRGASPDPTLPLVHMPHL